MTISTSLPTDWTTWARLNQLPTRDGREIAAFRVWLVLGGRGAGKTRCGAEWVRAQAQGLWPLAAAPAQRIALIGPTIGQVRSVMVEGVSGLLSLHGAGERPQFEPSLRRLVWPNGTVAEMFSAEQPDSLRGPQFDAAWCDELAKWRYPEATWDMLQFGLRLGEAPQVVVTTTPRPMPLLQRLVADETTLLARTPSADNRGFLAPQFLRDIEARYGGTRLGRQELDAEIIDDDPDALFRRDFFEARGRAARPIWCASSWPSIRRPRGAPGPMPAASCAPGWAATGAPMCSTTPPSRAPARRGGRRGPSRFIMPARPTG
jgi:phage terminase large subunit-like protein